MNQKNRVFKTLFSVTSLIIVGKLLGFVKQMAVASAFGTTIETDLISLSQGLIGNIQYVLVQTLLTSFISVYLHTRGRDETLENRFAADVLKVFLTIAAALMGIVLLLAPVLAKIIAPSYSGDLQTRLAGYLRLFSPSLLLFVGIAVFQALLDANKHFVPGQMEGINQSILMLLLIAVAGKALGVQTLVVGYFVYTVWNTVFLGICSRRFWSIKKGNPFRNPAVRQLLRMIAPLLLGYSMIYINQQVDKILVSGLEEGTVTALGYAAVLSNLVSTFIVTFGSILFSYLTSTIAKGDHGAAANMATRTASLLATVFLPISIITIFCARDIVTVAFGRGAFGEESIRVTALALAGYAVAFAPHVFQEVFARLQYGYQDSRRPMINSTISIVVNIVLSIILCRFWGVLGVTFASSVSTCVCGLLNTLTARRHNEFLRYRPFLRLIPWLAVGAVVCVLVTRWGMGTWQDSSALVRFVLVTLCAGGAYVVVVSPMLWRLIRRRPG